MVILMVTGIHFIEAYVLNPAIYSAHLKLHPLLVLTVLVVAEHSLGVWGLLLAGAPAQACLSSCLIAAIHSAALPPASMQVSLRTQGCSVE